MFATRDGRENRARRFRRFARRARLENKAKYQFRRANRTGAEKITAAVDSLPVAAAVPLSARVLKSRHLCAFRRRSKRVSPEHRRFCVSKSFDCEIATASAFLSKCSANRRRKRSFGESARSFPSADNRQSPDNTSRTREKARNKNIERRKD